MPDGSCAIVETEPTQLNSRCSAPPLLGDREFVEAGDYPPLPDRWKPEHAV